MRDEAARVIDSRGESSRIGHGVEVPLVKTALALGGAQVRAATMQNTALIGSVTGSMVGSGVRIA